MAETRKRNVGISAEVLDEIMDRDEQDKLRDAEHQAILNTPAPFHASEVEHGLVRIWNVETKKFRRIPPVDAKELILRGIAVLASDVTEEAKALEQARRAASVLEERAAARMEAGRTQADKAASRQQRAAQQASAESEARRAQEGAKEGEDKPAGSDRKVARRGDAS